MSTLTQLGREIHANALNKGFWDDTTSVLKKMNDNCKLHEHEVGLFTNEEIKAVESAFKCQKLLLIISEITEAMEADRIGKRADLPAFNERVSQVLSSMIGASVEEKEIEYARLYKEYVKDSFEGEMAGATIRMLDFCTQDVIPLEDYMRAEHRYNLTRPVKHGKGY